jgi:predicted Holliday junction resolvase-like endonuclease
MHILILIVLMLLPLSGCGVRTVAKVVTLPIKVTAKAVDLATTSQDEADLKRGREARKTEERAAKERRKAEKPEKL